MLKKMITTILAGIMLVCSLCGCSKDDNVQSADYDDYYKGVELDNVIGDVVKDGKSDYSIVIAANAGKAVEYAANEISDFITQSTGVCIPVIFDTSVDYDENSKFISLGKNAAYDKAGIDFDYSTLNYDGFIMKTVGKSLFIKGYYDRGTLYGAYDFLEKFLGVRFLSYDETYVPQNKEVKLYKMNVVEVPSFAMRSYLDGAVAFSTADLDFYARSRTNNTYVIANEKYGGSANVYGRGNDHNFHCYVPREIYYESHPEFYFYSEVYDIGGDNGWTIDLLNGIKEDGTLDESMDVSVAKIVIEEMKKDITAMPDVDFFVFEQEDGLHCYQYPVGSEKQKIVDKYGRSGILIRFCNLIARELQKWADEELDGRKINIVTFAYAYTKEPPVKTENDKYVPIDDTVRAADNLIVRLALAGNRYYSYFDDRSGQTELLNGWNAITDSFMFWAYDMDYTEYLWYMPFIGQISQNLEGFGKMNISYMLNQGEYNSRNNWMSTMKNYLYSRLYWNVNRNPYEILDEYLNLYYGVGGSYVKQMIMLFEEHFAKLFAEDPDLTINVTMDRQYKDSKYYTAELLEKATDFITAAQQAVKEQIKDDEECEKYLVRLARVKVTPMRMTMRYYQYLYPMADQRETKAFYKEFFDTCDYGGVTFWSESSSISALRKSYNID